MIFDITAFLELHTNHQSAKGKACEDLLAHFRDNGPSTMQKKSLIDNLLITEQNLMMALCMLKGLKYIDVLSMMPFL